MPLYIAVGRMLLGLTALLAPGLVTSALVGSDSDRPSVRYLARLIGARDLVLGAILLRATQTGEGVVPALWFGIASDVIDTKLSFLSRRGLTPWGRRLAMTAGLAYAATGAAQAVARRADPGNGAGAGRQT